MRRPLKLTTLSKTLIVLTSIFFLMDTAIKTFEVRNNDNLNKMVQVIAKDCGCDSTMVSRDSLDAPIDSTVITSMKETVKKVVNSHAVKTRLANEPPKPVEKKIKPNMSLLVRVQTAPTYKQARIAVKGELIKAFPPHGHYPFKDHKKVLNKILPDLIVADIIGRIPFENIGATVLCEGAHKTKVGREANNYGNVKFYGEGVEGVDFVYHWDDCKKKKRYSNKKDIPPLKDGQKIKAIRNKKGKITGWYLITKIKCKFRIFPTKAESLVFHGELMRKNNYTKRYKEVLSLDSYKPFKTKQLLDAHSYAQGIGGYAGGYNAPLKQREEYKQFLRDVMDGTRLRNNTIREKLGLPLDPEFYSLLN
jgi:hypothetical protein